MVSSVTEVVNTEWLTEKEQHAWRLFLRFQRTFADRLSDELAVHGLDFADFEVLTLLSEAPDRQLRMTEIAKMIVSPRSRLTYQVDQLAVRGLVERIKCETDRRGFFAHLTEPGWQKVKAVAPVHVAGVRVHLFDLLTEAELASMHSILMRAMEKLEAEPSMHLVAARDESAAVA